MSGGTSLAPYPDTASLGVHTIAYHKDFLGWIPPDRKYVAAPNTTRTITLERLAKPGAEGYLMAQIPIGESPTDFYTVEARLFAGYDEEVPDEAIVIHKVDTTREDRLAQVVDIDNNGDPNDEGVMWTVGEIFTDRENAFQISIDAAYDTGYRVTINTDRPRSAPASTFCPRPPVSSDRGETLTVSRSRRQVIVPGRQRATLGGSASRPGVREGAPATCVIRWRLTPALLSELAHSALGDGHLR